METKGSFDINYGLRYNGGQKEVVFMTMNRIKDILRLCWVQLLMILCGAVLVFFPDSAVALATKVLAWILVIVGIFRVIGNLNDRQKDMGDWVFALLFLLAGFYMIANPLSITNLIGRIFGLVLILQGAKDLKGSVHGSAKILSLVTLIAGIVLFLLPKTLINTVLGLAGLVLIVIGAINMIDKLRHGNRLTDGSDPNIIDADE